MTTRTSLAASTLSFGWLRTPPFDLTLTLGVAALALASGGIVLAKPELFPLVLFLDLWLLGFHHVVATFTRLSFDLESLKEHRFLVLYLPVVVVMGVVALALAFGPWSLATAYLYWQWFHYTRQSYGIERIYRRKSKAELPSPRITAAALYLVALWGILYRSHQAPETFLDIELKVLPTPELAVTLSGALAVVAMAAWLVEWIQVMRRGERPLGHTLYVLSHFVIFVVSYLLIANMDYGWLVVNVWHNAQYIMIVWMFNSNRFRSGVSSRHRFLSTISQREKWPLYLLVCLGISTVVYFGLDSLLGTLSSIPAIFMIVYQSINFHHYIVDGIIWKLRKKPLQERLGLAS